MRTLAVACDRGHARPMFARSAGVVVACMVVLPASADTPKKGATLVAAEGKLAVAGGSATSGAVLVAGTAVSAGEDAHAVIDLGDARISVAPQTIFHVFGAPGSKKAAAASTLANGIVRIAATKPIAIASPAGKIVFDGDAKLHVEKGVTRISVHKGTAKLSGATVGEGFGVRVGKGKPTKLPAAPTWTAPPKSALTTKGDAPIDVTGMIGGTATRWHLQVAMDEAFTEYLTDTQLAAKSTTLVFEQKLPPGRYWVRVSALDADGLEGAWSTVAAVQILSKP